jgi:hypothetical protein
VGRPQVVSDIGWFAELPDTVALKVPVGEGETEVLARHLTSLAGDPEARARMGAAAHTLAEQNHGLDLVAEAYAAALEEAAGGEAVADAVLREVAGAAADVGLSRTGELAERLGEVGLGR